MSEVKRHLVVAGSECSEMVYASDYDALAQRCRKLEAERNSIAHRHEKALLIGAELRQERDALRSDVERLRQALRSVIVAAGGSAAPDVSTEFLEQAPLEVLALRGKLDQLQARLRRIEYIAECGSVQSWLAMPDDVKAQWFAMHLEMDDERRALRQDTARLQWLADNMRLMSGHKATGHYQLPELVEWVESAREGCTLDDLRAALDAMAEAI